VKEHGGFPMGAGECTGVQESYGWIGSGGHIGYSRKMKCSGRRSTEMWLCGRLQCDGV